MVPEVLSRAHPARIVTIARVHQRDGQEMQAVNDLFIGLRSHVSSCYKLSLGNRVEIQSSSGIIVSTGLESTRWLRSLVAGTAGISGGYLSKELAQFETQGFPRDSE